MTDLQAGDGAPASAAGPRRGPSGRTLAYAATVLLAGGFIYLAVRNVKLAEAWRALRSSNYLWLLPSLVAFGLSTAARALRWQALFERDRRPPLGPVANAMMVGYLFNNILPARAGEAARVVTLTERAGTPPAEIVGTVLVERIYDVVSILVVFFAAGPWLPHVSWFGAAGALAGGLALVIAAAVAVLAVYGERPVLAVLRPFGRLPFLSPERVVTVAAELAGGLHGLRDARVAISGLAWSLAAWVLSALSAWFVLLAFQPHLGLDAGVLLVTAIGLSMILPSPPAAVGVFEAASLLALKAYGISETQALPFAVVLHVVNFLPYVAVGLLLLQFNARGTTRRLSAEGAADGGNRPRL